MFRWYVGSEGCFSCLVETNTVMVAQAVSSSGVFFCGVRGVPTRGAIHGCVVWRAFDSAPSCCECCRDCMLWKEFKQASCRPLIIKQQFKEWKFESVDRCFYVDLSRKFCFLVRRVQGQYEPVRVLWSTSSCLSVCSRTSLQLPWPGKILEV